MKKKEEKNKAKKEIKKEIGKKAGKSSKKDIKNSKKKWTNEIEEAKNRESMEQIEGDLDEVEEDIKKLRPLIGSISSEEVIKKVEVKASKPIIQLKKGNKIKVDGVEFVVDTHYVLMDHGKTKEMTIEIFNPKTDNDYQLRYFSDQIETSIEFYELQEILYVRRPIQRVEW